MGNREIKNSYTKSDAERLLEEINSWIQHADNKASILIAFLAILIGLTTNIYKAFAIINNCIITSTAKLKAAILIFFLILYFCSMLLTIIFLAFVLIARKSVLSFKKAQGICNKSFLFYNDIASIGFEIFNKTTKTLSDDDIINELNKQIITNSYIAKRKYHFFNCALITSLILLICTIFLLILVNV